MGRWPTIRLLQLPRNVFYVISAITVISTKPAQSLLSLFLKCKLKFFRPCTNFVFALLCLEVFPQDPNENQERNLHSTN